MKKPCKFPGCREVLRVAGYCEQHAKGHKDGQKLHASLYDQWRRKGKVDLRQAQQVRSSAKWKKVRWLKITMNPLCEDPHGFHARKGTTETATQVHHIISAGSRPDLAFDAENLMSVCASCHARLEALIRREL
jgi:5-methylcytosine-specific restriction endonuclease McrA